MRSADIILTATPSRRALILDQWLKPGTHLSCIGSVMEGKQELEEQMKNRMTVRHGMLTDLETYLKQSGWKLEEPVGAYEVLRARNPNYPRPLLVHDRAERGVGYSIDERDVKVYNGWRRNRRKRGIDPDWPTQEERSRYFEGRDGV